MSENNWTNNPAFTALSPEKQKFLEHFSKETKNKSPNETLSLLLSTMRTLKEQNISFTKEETSLLIESLTANLSPTEKLAVEALRSRMNTSNFSL